MKHILFKSLLYNYQYGKLILRIKNLLKKWKFISHFASTDSIHQEWQLPFTTSLGMFSLIQGFPCGSASKESTCNVGNLGSILGLRRSPGEGKGYPLQYSGLENSMDCIVRGGLKKSDTTERLSLTHSLVSRTQLFNRSFGASCY